MIYLDTETCGFHGPTIIIQWAEDDGPVNIHHVWRSPIGETLALIEKICENTVCAFNLAFDWFHLCQTYTTLKLLVEITGPEELPEDYIEDYAICEEKARFGDCLKPAGALDLMLIARKGPYQSTMDRSDIRIKRIPTVLAWELAKELDKRIPLPDIYFARKKDKKTRWQVFDIHDDEGFVIPEFKDLVLKFAPSAALKALVHDALGISEDSILLFMDVNVDRKFMPVELGYAPYALAIGKPGNWKGAWPDVIHAHIDHWSYNKYALEYASKDVEYLQKLYVAFGEPEANDDDSILAAMVGTVRWKGFAIDREGLTELRDQKIRELAKVRFQYSKPTACREYLEAVLSETDLAILRDGEGKISTKGIILEELAKWREEEVHGECSGQGCHDCNDGLLQSETPHPAAIRAQEILDARHAKKEIELFEKLLKAGRFHASFKVIGTLSSRMSGTDGLNAQGIKNSKLIRSKFPLADGIYILVGGDFSGFEVTLMDAAYGDPDLRADLLQKRPCMDCKGVGCDECEDGMAPTKIHALFGQFLFPGMTYEEIYATKVLPGEKNKYTRSKNGVFAMAYGGQAYTLKTRVGVDEATAEKAYQMWIKKYKVLGS